MTSTSSPSMQQLQETWASATSQAEQTTSQFTAWTQASSIARKNLAESTKELKRLLKDCPGELGIKNKNTIKAYQEEIDNLTKQRKAAEMAYLELSQVLSILNPTALLDTAVTAPKASGDEEVIRKLRQEIAEYEVEFRSLKNQEITIRKLETRLAELMETHQRELQEAQLKVTHAENQTLQLQAAVEERDVLERKLQTLQVQVQAERAGREATQAHLLQADQGVSQREAAWEAQKRILIDDSERLREQLQAITQERDQLKLRVTAFETNNKNNRDAISEGPTPLSTPMHDIVLERNAYQAEVAELSETANLLRQELAGKEQELSEERRARQTQLDELLREKEALRSNVVSLERQLEQAPDPNMVQSMQRELRILKRLEYNAERDPEIVGDDNNNDLETVLVNKLRRVESELVTERTRQSELMAERDALQQALVDAQAAKEQAEQLVAALEQDLEKVSNPTLQKAMMDPTTTTATTTTSLSTSQASTERADDDHSVATIVMAQRDRLRARCDALEAERDSFKRELQVQVQASESLKADNAKLYEKVRYLQNYSGKRVDRDLDLEALEQRYEASVDPFKQFSKAERARKLKEMSPVERTVFLVAKTFLATKEMRTGLFFYVLTLHMLVFITTYHWSHTGGCHNVDHERLSHLPPNMPEFQKKTGGET